MTIGNAGNRVSFNCNGVSAVFPVPLQSYLATDFDVWHTTAAGASALLTLNSDFAMVASSTDQPPKWTLTTTVTYPSGDNLQVIVDPDQVQQTQYVSGQAFASSALQQNVDRLTQMVQRLQDQISRAPVASDGDVSPILSLGTALQRANRFPTFDSLGNMSLATVLPSGTFSSATIASTLNSLKQTPAEAAVGVIPVDGSYLPGDVRRYGAVLDNATDCVAALVTACKVGGMVTAPGNMALASASLALLPNNAIALLSGTTIQGYKGYTCTITGTTPCNVFWSINPTNINIQDFICVGNGANSATSTTGYFWYLQGTGAAAAELGNIYVGRNTLSNFAGLYWIYVDQTLATTFPFTRFVAENNNFKSLAGNCQPLGLTNVTTTASVFGFSGSNTITSFYTVKDVDLRNNFADGTFIKEFVFFWSGTLRCKAHDNTLIGFGSDSSISDDTGCYALAAYDFAHGAALAPHEIEFYDNNIDVVRDCGIYTAAANQLTVQNNRVKGQTSLANTLLPKGGIVLNGLSVTALGNTMTACAIGMTAVQALGSTRCDIIDSEISAVSTNGVGLWLSGTTGGNAPTFNVNGITITTAAGGVKGIHLIATSTVGINDLNIQNFDINGCANGIDLLAPDSSVPNLGNVRIGRGRFRNISGNNIQWLNCTNVGSRSTFESIDFMDMIPGAVGFFFQNCVNVTVRAFTFYDMTSGGTFCWYGAGAQGRVEGVRYVNVAVANRFDSGANQLGVNTPTWTGNDNDFVQDLNTTELIQVIAATNVKYTRDGWTWDRVAAAWKERRCLTGN